MSSNAYADREAIFAALAQAETAHRVLASASLDALSAEEVLEVLARREALAWRAPAVDHRLLARLVVDGNPGVLGAANLTLVLEERLRISRGVARRRLAEAADLGPRVALDGQPLEPVMPTVAQGAAAGVIGPEQIAIVRDTYAKIPAAVDPETRADAEKELAELAASYGPAHLQKLATVLLMVLDPDGDFADRRRAAKRGLSVGAQTHDGMRNLRASLTPEAWATLEPILEKLAAPGMCNPEDEHPCVSGTPSEDQIQGDKRTVSQRNHDALVAAMRALLASGDLGQHNGLPVTVIVTTTLAELEAAAHGGAPADLGTAPTVEPSATTSQPPACYVPAALTGWAVTAGGSFLPMSDLLRMASHAIHYLTVFDGHGRALWLGRTKRLANADQRIVLYARDKGCTKPGCTHSAYRCQAHHLTPYGRGREGRTDIDDLGLACGRDNTMADTHNWTTHLNTDGRVEWTPPKHLNHGQPRVNPYHQPADMLAHFHKRFRHQHPPGTDPPHGSKS
ncbi:HNH endonuclease signature motif containing protein [Mycolicibacterium brumae]|uniref:HNH endonuclease n=1 Tax=Mycolicibacterium brumae TaxID=85968 RepID=A0A2G5PBU8_9MYCO|nr:HNH endonuclease signature motif containing protein [Mycolicibacterium brumae]MCV7193046.1 HNH endonuclease [Mycolicibacterium brumae]PIB75364.1 HNH endonuclease [Mycolicibacterium brumae]RWA22029.1 hypothetical protein MBRU_13675 [Mycolicibacterium brumae DSM 44177]UWW07952.1 HNH endonuclease [Mycolicibacterium brumae]